MGGHDTRDWRGWRVGVINLKCSFNGEVVDIPAAGWTKGDLGLDFRALADDEHEFTISGWCLTHLPTGYVVRYIDAGHTEALEIADEIAACADWSFEDATKAKHLGQAVLKVAEAHPGKVFGGTRSMTPRP